MTSGIKDDYKYLTFVIAAHNSKTDVWSCRTKHGDELGQVRWYSPWRQYCYFPDQFVEAVYSEGCLRDIADFIKQLNDAWRQRK